MFDTVAGHQVRRAAADAVRVRRVDERARDVGMAGEPEVVVAAEVEQSGARHHPPRAFEIPRREVGERRRQR
jgi:hypothetical protein